MLKHIIAILTSFALTTSIAYADYEIKKEDVAGGVRYVYATEKGEITEGPNGFAAAEGEYNNKQEYPKKIRLLNADMNRTQNMDGVSVLKYKYDGWSRVTEIVFYNMEGKIQKNKYGYAILRVRYKKGKTSYSFYTRKKEKIKIITPEMKKSIEYWITESNTPKLYDAHMDFSKYAVINTQGVVRKESDVSESKKDAKVDTGISLESNPATENPSADTEAETAFTDKKNRNKVEDQEPEKEQKAGIELSVVWLDTSGNVTDEKTYMSYEEEPSTSVIPSMLPTDHSWFRFVQWKLDKDTGKEKTYIPIFEEMALNRHVIIWLNDDNTIFSIKAKDTESPDPTLDIEPAKESDDEYDYVFVGWDMGEHEKDWSIYRPVFTKTPKNTQEISSSE